jgi:glutaminyl-tRNA synthetase
LRYGYIVRCVGAEKDAGGKVTVVHCTYDPETKSGTPGADARKVKGNLHWLSTTNAVPAEVRLYDRLFAVPFPGARNPKGARVDGEPDTTLAHTILVAGEDEDEELVPPVERDYLDDLNPESKRVITAFVEGALKDAVPEDRFQFERHGYFVADLANHAPGKPVFNRTVTLRDSWAKP